MLVEKLKKDMIEAMKNKDKERIDKKVEVNDDLLIDVINKQVKLRNDSLEEFKKANRDDLVKQTEAELEILKDYLPEQLSEEEVITIIEEVINEVNAETIKDMGKVMKEVTPKVKGKTDMKFVSEIIKSKLN